MPADKLRPEDIDAAIAASQGQGRRHGPRLDPDDLTAIEASYRTRGRQDANHPGHGLRDSLAAGSYEPEADDPGIPPYPERPRPDVAYADAEERRSGGRRRPWPMLLAGLVLGAFAAFIWWAYGTESPGEPGPAPLIKAEEGAAKVRPEDEGGLQVPFQDKLIYSQIEPDPNRDPVERLLPPPPAPVAPPEPSAAEAAPADPALAESGPAESGPPAPEPEQPAADTAPPAAVAEAPAAEEAGAPNPSPVPAIPVQSAPIGEAMEEAPGAEAVSESDVGPPPPAAEPAKPETAEAAGPEPTSTEKPAPAEAAAPQLAKAASAFRVQLAAFRSSDSAKSAWTILRDRHPELLGSLELTVVRADLGDKGIFYRVQAGPLADRAAAKSLCSRLQERKQACLIVAP